MSSLSSAIELANILQRCFALYQTKSTNDQDPYIENKNQVLLKLITKWWIYFHLKEVISVEYQSINALRASSIASSKSTDCFNYIRYYALSDERVHHSSTGINYSSDSHDCSSKITHFPQLETSTDLSATNINREFSYDQHDVKTSILQLNITKPHD